MKGDDSDVDTAKTPISILGSIFGVSKEIVAWTTPQGVLPIES